MRLRERIGSGIAAVAMSALVVGSATASSTAAWVDEEWVRADAAALACGDTSGLGVSTANGRMLSGSLLDIDLDSLAEVRGVTARSDGIETTPTPATAGEVPGSSSTAFRDALAVELVDALLLDLTGVSGLLQLPLGNSTGVYTQYARAGHDLTSTGAAGLVTDEGIISLSAFDGSMPADERPQFARIRLTQLLTEVTGETLSSLVGNVTDLELAVGALAASAQLDGCDAVWTGDVYDHLERHYGIAGLALDVASPTVGALATGASSAAATFSTALDGITSASPGVRVGVSGVLSSLIGPLMPAGTDLDALLGTPTITLDVGVDTSVISSVLDDTISDSGGIVDISLTGGTISVDLERLLGAAYASGPGLNGLAPNTEVLIDDDVILALTGAVTSALQDWVDDVVGRLLGAVQVQIVVQAPLTITVVEVGKLTVSTGPTATPSPVSLATLLAGSAPLNVSISLPLIDTVCTALAVLIKPLCDAVRGLQAGLLANVGALASGLAGVVGGLVNPLVVSLQATLDALIQPVVTVVSGTLGGLFGEGALLSLVVNAQNDPDPSAVNAQPELASWGAIDGAMSPGSTGRYDVAALTIGAVGLLDVLELHLGRASAGANTVD